MQTDGSYRLGSLPSGWRISRVADIGLVRTGRTPRTSEGRFFGGEHLFVTPGDIDDSRWVTSTERTLTEEGLAEVRSVAEKSVFVTCIGELGRVGQALAPVATNQQINSIEPAGLVDPHYLYHASTTLKPQMEKVAGRQVVAIVKKSSFEKLVLRLPPLPEQRRIAEILDTVDEAIRKTEEVIAKLEQIKKGLLHDLLTRGIDENGELRDPERHPEEFKDSELGRIPRGWKISHAGREFEITSGFTLGPHRQPRRNAYPYLRVANVYRDELVLADIQYLEASPAELSTRALVAGDLLVVEGHANPNQIGRCAIATPTVEGFTFQNHLFRLRTRQLHAGFAALWMNGHEVRRHWRKVCSTSSGLNTINQAKLRVAPVLCPPSWEQEAITQRMGTVRTVALKERQLAAKLRLLKKGLMDDLLTGRVRVPVKILSPT